MTRLWIVAACLCLPCAALAEDAAPAEAHLARFRAGAGPTREDGLYRLLDDAGTPGQCNAVAFDRTVEGGRASWSFRCELQVAEGGEGGAICFLDTASYGVRGPAPCLVDWTAPNLRRSLAVGIDVYNPPSKEMFTPWGNYQDLPQREVSLHFDGRELVKRVAPAEFRGAFHELRVDVQQVIGGAEVSVAIAGAPVYERAFVPHMLPYEMRVALGAATRADGKGAFDVKGLALATGGPALPVRPPLHVELFNHVLTDNATTSYTTTADLPPAAWAFGRVILSLDIHDAGKAWDEWDRNGHLTVTDDDGTPRDIAPFITSYRTPCHWEIDVSAYRPWLAGQRTFEIAAGTTFYKNRGYMMSASLDFHHGAPELEPYRLTPLWYGVAHYGVADNHFRDFFAPRQVTLGEDTQAARVVTTVTGHSQVGEFTPSRRTLVFAPQGAEAVRFENTLWKTDCYLNPNRPQFGTWQFSRAGWAPGDWVRPWWVDLTPHVRPGATAGLRYEPESYTFPAGEEHPTDAETAAANHVVRSTLVEYRRPTGLLPAPVLRVSEVTKGGNADTAGLRPGDYLAAYDDTRLDALDDLRAALAAAAQKERVLVVVYRGLERLELQVAPGRLGITVGNR